MSTQSNTAPANGWFSKSDLETKVEEARLAIPEAKRPEKATGWKSKSDLEATLAEYQALGPASASKEALEARIATLESQLAAAKASPVPAAGARLVEQASRKTAQELSAERRNVLTRSQFNALDHAKRGEHVRNGGRVTDDPAPGASVGEVSAAQHLAANAKPTMTRTEFNKLPHSERAAAVKQYTLIP